MKEKRKVLVIHGNGNPIVNKVKIGRNDICKCGSGLKFKKCCETRFENETRYRYLKPKIKL